MAVHKATHSNPLAQLHPNHQFKAEIFEILHNLNRGYGIALAALDRLEIKDRCRAKAGPRLKNGLRIFTATCLGEFHARTKSLQAEANRDLLRLMATHEDQYTERVGRVENAKKHRS